MYSLNIECRSVGQFYAALIRPLLEQKEQQYYAKCLAASKDCLYIKMFKLHMLHIITRLHEQNSSLTQKLESKLEVYYTS